MGGAGAASGESQRSEQLSGDPTSATPRAPSRRDETQSSGEQGGGADLFRYETLLYA